MCLLWAGNAQHKGLQVFQLGVSAVRGGVLALEATDRLDTLYSSLLHSVGRNLEMNTCIFALKYTQ